MFKWPRPPSVGAPEHELADFAELICWQRGLTSATALSRLLGRLAENDYSDGVPEEEEADRRVEGAYGEIERRQEACRRGYPFEIGREGHTLRVIRGCGNPAYAIYKYLLLSTRLNMRNDRSHAGIDGTLLLESLSAQVAKGYFGERAESMVFGTAASGAGFGGKVDTLCRRLGEGGGYTGRSPASANVRDGKLDVVVWQPFTDDLPGKLMGFGQCKTGTNYKDSVTVLQPDAFVKKWLREPLVVAPVRMFFVSEALAATRDDRYEISVDAGLLFDRCRIVDYCDGVDAKIIARVRQWTEAAGAANELPGPKEGTTG